MRESYFLFGDEAKMHYLDAPDCQDGNDRQLSFYLSSLNKDELYQAVHIRAAMWDLMDFINDQGGYLNFDSWDDMIAHAKGIVLEQEEEAAFRASYEGRKQEYESMRKSLKKAMLKRGDKLECRHCGAKKFISIDHIHPLIHGGTNELSNLQFLCRSCNSRKHAKLNYTPISHTSPPPHTSSLG